MSSPKPSLTVGSIVAHTEGKPVPLPTLHAINLAHGGQPLTPTSSICANETLEWEIQQLRKKRVALPTNTYAQVIRDTFSKPAMGELNTMQALKALDYLRDLEDRRVSYREKSLNAIQEATEKTKLKEKDLQSLPSVQEWFSAIRRSEDRCSGMYTSLFLDLRRWIMYKEVNADAFSVQNCIAMVNTLYSGILTAAPPPQVPMEVVEWTRESWIRQVPHMAGKSSRKQSESSDFQKTIAVLESYLKSATQMMDYCSKVATVTDAEREIRTDLDIRNSELPAKVRDERARMEKIEKIYGSEEARKFYTRESERYNGYGEATRQGRKVDSGVSFASNTSSALKRPSTSDSTMSIAASTSASMTDRATCGHSHTSSQDSGRGPSLYRTDTDMSKSERTAASLMRRMKSFSDMSHLKNKSVSNAVLNRQNSDVEFFDVDAMKQQREAWEAKQPTPTRTSDDVASIRGQDENPSKHKLWGSLRRKRN